MSSLIHYTACPVCGSAAIREVLKARDFTVSGETFTIMECSDCSLRFTQDVPDAKTIGPYYQSEDYISHTNTSKGLVNKLYQWVRKKTLVQKRKLVERVTGIKKGRILDVGSGTGAFVHTMKEQGWEVTGLEPDAGARAVALQQNRISLDDMTAFDQLNPGQYDAITLWHVLEHVHELPAYVQQLKKLLCENGRIFIAVPNYTATEAAVYGEYWAAYDVPRHLYHFSPRSMQVLMDRQGLKLTGYRPMWYDSFYITMLSSKYKNGHTRLLPSAWHGFRSNLKAWGNTKRCSSVIYIISK